MGRLFIAAQPAAEVLDAVERLARPEINGLRWTSRHQWHVTLRFLGHVDDAATVMSALAKMEAAPTGAVLGPATGRFGHRVLHVPVTGLEALAADVVSATKGLGRAPDDRPFAGHLTLARVVKGARVDLGVLEGRPISAEWPVREVVLLQSDLSRRGAAYDVVASRQLVPRL